MFDDVEVERAVLDKDTGIPRIDNQGNPLMERVVEQQPVTDLMALHRRRTSDIEQIVKDNLGNPNASTVIGLREDLTDIIRLLPISAELTI